MEKKLNMWRVADKNISNVAQDLFLAHNDEHFGKLNSFLSNQKQKERECLCARILNSFVTHLKKQAGSEAKVENKFHLHQLFEKGSLADTDFAELRKS